MNFPFRFPIVTLLTLVVATSALTFTLSKAEAQQPRPAAVNQTPPPQKPPSNDEPEAEVVRVETDLVNTLFTAVDKDRHFVTTLHAEDVRIFENDAPQTVSMFQRETDRPLSLAILVDTSVSQ
jgi:hypothetical protein